MKPSIQTLGHILYSPSQYVIPVFQRNYRWEELQWAKLWENLVEIQDPKKVGNHFLGFLVFVPGLPQPGQNTTFHLVDGQQRLATSSILLAAVRNIARQVGQQELADEIHQYYLVHPIKKGEQHYRLLPKERDHDSYLSLVNGHGKPAGRMADALRYFEDRLSNYSADSPERLRQVFDTVCQRFEFMCATLETENAYNIFKSLNSTGVPLGPADLIRNFVFMHVRPDEQDEFDRDLWGPLEDRFVGADGTLDEDRFSKFFRDFLMSSGRYVAPRATFPSFESRYEATDFSPRELARALTVSARHYAIISGQEADKTVHVTQALAALNLLESSTTYPLLLALFERRDRGAITDEEFAEAVKMLCGFILRRFVCGESSRGYGPMFVRALSKEQDGPIKTLETYLLERGWPDDRRFEAAFVEFPLFQRGYTREVLVTLERARGHREPADLKNAQVEHILPQTLSDAWREALGTDAERIHGEWLHRPGNLTLSAYNRELWNYPFEKKRKVYDGSHIVLTKELVAYERWTEVEILERGLRLAREAAQIWMGPKGKVVQGGSDAGDGSYDPGGSGSADTKQLQLEFWQQLQSSIAERSEIIKVGKARPQSWMYVSMGSSEFYLEATIKSRERRIGVDLAIVGANAKKHYHLLCEQREEIECASGEPLTWWELPKRKSSYISLYRYDSPLGDRKSWPAQHKWLLEKLELFHRTFAQRVTLLDDSTEGTDGTPAINATASIPTME